VLVEFLLDTTAPLSVRIALRLWLIRAAIRAKADTVFTMANPLSKMAAKFVGLPLLQIPDRVLPHATPIFVRAQNEQSKHFEADRSIHLTLGDLDFF
jgi:hypothetical protein